jgi:hydrogenase maturation protease
MKTLVIGVGNEYRCDDAVGLLVARHICELNLPHVRVIESDGEFARLMDAWKDAESVILIDAVQSGALPGTIHRFAAHEEKLPASLFQCSTHAFGVAGAIELAKTLGQLPPQLVVFGIEAESFDTGAALSVAVARALEALCRLVQQEIARESDKA